jgi:hypothetical protein
MNLNTISLPTKERPKINGCNSIEREREREREYKIK